MTAFSIGSLTATYTDAELKASEYAPGIGDIHVSHDNKRYRLVKYRAGAGNIAAVAGNVVGFYAPGGVSTGVSNEVTSDVSDTAANGAGVLQAVIADGSWGWIQVGGVATVTTALVSGGDGQALVLSVTTDGTLKVAAAVTETICATAIDASAKIIMCNFPY